MSSRFNKRLGSTCLSILFAVAVAAGCDDTSESATCLDKLNDKKYSSVAGDDSCSTYERGSAELGLAGFEFSSFISTSALTNFPSTLGLTLSGCKISGTDKLSKRSYFSEFHEHYLRSQYYTRWLYTENNRTQPLFDAEIAMFAAAGEIIAQTYCEVDANLNGVISEKEISNFTAIQDPTGSTSITETGYILAVVVDSVGDSVAWLIDTNVDGAWQCQESPIFSSVWSLLSGSIETDNETCAALVVDASEISVVLGLDSMSRLFLAGTTVSDIEGAFNLLNSSLQKGDDIIQDLTTIGLQEGSQIRDSIEAQMAVLDNGGTCSSAKGTIGALDTLAVILENAEPAESYDDTSVDLENNNLFTEEQIESISGSPVSCPDGVSSCSARFIYSDSDSGGDFTDLYMLANDDIAETLSLSDALLFDPDTGLLRESEAGDFDITLSELLCFR